MAYYVDGREVSESTKEVDQERACRVLRRRVDEARRGEAVPHESRLTVEDLVQLLVTDYEVKQRRSLATVRYPLR
jgi:hypothetical protein